ncbi:MAG: 50S ribosomal protein L32 [Desulfobacteraceae bacterium 4572_35.1]|nr:MAG: 50S ribosomal protein L32 [Desulfobacteraceae bacterium 4572_35.1]
MAVPKKKTSKSRRDMRRSHDSLIAPGISVCPQCDEPKQPHRVCGSCGFYKDRNVLESES